MGYVTNPGEGSEYNKLPKRGKELVDLYIQRLHSAQEVDSNNSDDDINNDYESLIAIHRESFAEDLLQQFAKVKKQLSDSNVTLDVFIETKWKIENP